MDIANKDLELFCKSIYSKVISRTECESKKTGRFSGVGIKIEKIETQLIISIYEKLNNISISIPIPYLRNGIDLIENNGVERALCKYFIEDSQTVLDYYSAIYNILCSEPGSIIPENKNRKTINIQRMIYAVGKNDSNIANFIAQDIQRMLNNFVNRYPLHEVDMKSWVINRRLMVIDPIFDEIKDPEEKLAYQLRKSKKYFDRGWTVFGLSDGVLADKNYILTYDIRKLTPFGMRYHNPQRNLYSTLGMKGDEIPKVISKSMHKLSEMSINRKGWNLFTLFSDVSDVFEDQIMVDESHKGKAITYTKRYQCFGTLTVKPGDELTYDNILSIAEDGKPNKFCIDCDKARVNTIEKVLVNIGNMVATAYNVTVEYKRYLRDGVKITNLHGNKGVIRFRKLGYAVDPRTGDKRNIDVIASGSSIKKRKNFGQLLEALINNTTRETDKPVILEDNYRVNLSYVMDVLEANKLPRDGKWACETTYGNIEGICGEVFWGVTANVENNIWHDSEIQTENTNGVRTAGLKFSHVEMRALDTQFGKGNAISEEILSYVQGMEDLKESLRVIKSKLGINQDNKSIFQAEDMTPVCLSLGSVMGKDLIRNTFADEVFEPNGFILKLPLKFQTCFDTNDNVLYEGIYLGYALENSRSFEFDSIYVPHSTMRACWRHNSGKVGLNPLGNIINNLIILSIKYVQDKESIISLNMLTNAVFTYFRYFTNLLNGKRGIISQYGMAIRYPMSAKATATLSNDLLKNTVEIHKSMADMLSVKSGDIVLVERFPCLGFMSLRPQMVKVTEDEMCRYTIRVSGNNLCSMGLDFDGDVIYLASFHTEEAKKLLSQKLISPDPECKTVIDILNAKTGIPKKMEFGLSDYNIIEFGDVTLEEHLNIVNNAVGVKSHTGPVIALSYNVMRIIENSVFKNDKKVNVAVEVFLDKVGNTVFKQKHGVKSLHSIVTDAICTGDVKTLIEHGFEKDTSENICRVIASKAKNIGVNNLKEYNEKAKENKWSNVVSRLVRKENKIYFASRSNFEPFKLFKYLSSAAVDVPSLMFKRAMASTPYNNNTPLSIIRENKQLNKIKSTKIRTACKSMLTLVDRILNTCKDKLTTCHRIAVIPIKTATSWIECIGYRGCIASTA